MKLMSWFIACPVDMDDLVILTCYKYEDITERASKISIKKSYIIWKFRNEHERHFKFKIQHNHEVQFEIQASAIDMLFWNKYDLSLFLDEP